MKVQVMHDQHGKPVASFQRHSKSGVTLEPKLQEGHKVTEVEVPEDFASNLHVVYKPHGK